MKPQATAALFLFASLSAQSVWDLARPAVRPFGAPKASDICFSSRWERPAGKGDSNDSFEAAKAFHATQWVWLYPSAGKDFADYLRRVKATGAGVNAAVNNILSDTPASRAFTLGRVKNLAGESTAPQFMRAWKVMAGCSIHPDFFKIYVDEGKRLLDAGADSLQDDSMSWNDAAPVFGGCFCEACMAGFRAHLATRFTASDWKKVGVEDGTRFDYRRYLLDAGTPTDANVGHWKGHPDLKKAFLDFQHEGVLSFCRRAHEAWNRHAGRRVPVSRNEYKDMLEWSGPPLFDYGITEWYGAPNVEAFWSVAREGREKKTAFILTYAQFGVFENRLAIAAAYAGGMHIVAPWDVFTGATTPRVFGTAAEYGDLFGFVRAIAPLLDGHEDGGAFTGDAPDARYGRAPPLHLVGEGEIYASLRVKPGTPSSPVVVHLVDGRKNPASFQIALDPARFGGSALEARLFTPAPFDAAAHERARGDRDYRALAKSELLSTGEKTLLSIPALSAQWGVLVLTPVSRPGRAVCQPHLSAPALRFEGGSSFTLGCLTPGAQVRYTLDGNAPSPASPLASAAIAVTKSVRVRAVAFLDGKASAEFDAPLQKLPSFDFQRDPSLILWCLAEDLKATHGDGQPVAAWKARRGPSPSNLAGRAFGNGTPLAPPRYESYQEPFPVVRFNGRDEALALPGFVNERLAKGFTLFMVSRSEDEDFGIGGNTELGNGGVPRLYMVRSYMIANALSNRVKLFTTQGKPEAHVFQWNGRDRLGAARCGQNLTEISSDPVTAFGDGGSLAIPFWSGNRNHPGDLAEILAFDRVLEPGERQAVERHLNRKYGLH